MAEVTRKRSDGLETIEKVIRFAREELESTGPVKFNLLKVIERSGVSRSSIYHHFGDREGVIAAVQSRDVVDDVAMVNQALRALVEKTASAREAINVIEFYLGSESGDNGEGRRLRRISTLMAAESSPALMKVLRDNQVNAVAYLAETFDIARQRGLIDPIAPTEGIAHMVLSLLLGRILVDITGDPDADALWRETVMASFDRLLRPLN